MNRIRDDIDDRDDGDMPPPIRGLAGLSMEREPEHDLWPAIQARIAQQQAGAAASPRVLQPRRRWLPMTAAAAVTAVLAGLIGLRQLQQTPPAAAPTVVALNPVPAADAPAARSAASPEAAMQTLAMNEAQRLQGPNRALVKANLKIVKSAEDQLRQALATDPNDQYLQSLLASAQDQKQHLRGLLDRNLI